MSYLTRHPILFLLPLFLLATATVTGQVQTPRYNTPIGSNAKGFYEYLPQGYDVDNGTYPLIVFLHGRGELGNGDAATLPDLLTNGLPKVINDGKFPVSFTVNGTAHKFIVISPQFVAWPSPIDVEQVINYAASHYRVSVNRVYVTGLSMGGGATWDYAGDNSIYANRLAAIVPICGASYPEPAKGRVMAAANLPVWATHNSGDDVVAVYKTNGYIDYVNQAPAPVPAAKKTIFAVSGHNSWTKTYNPLFKEDGLNIYEWMLQYRRIVLTAGSNSPVCYDSVLRLSAWNVEGASYSWTGPNGFTSALREPAITPVTDAVAGVYTVTLSKGDSTATASTTVAVTAPGIFYRDGDQDGYGAPSQTLFSCRPPRGYTTRSGDCNDSKSSIYAGAPELCDGLDNNCNGQVDEGLAVNRYYRDVDKDGWGIAGTYKDSCAQPVGYAMNYTDCNDGNATVYPGALELADGLDNDCNGKTDDNAVAGIKVNLYGGTNPYAAPDWNNWNVSASLSSGAFKYVDATASPLSATLSSNSGVTDNGTTYGSGMAPAEVLRYTSSANTTRTLTISGLFAGKTYNLELYATRNANSGYTTVFTIGATSVSVSTYKNLTNKAAFVNLSPNTSGQIAVTIKNSNAYSYLAGFMLTENNSTAAENKLPTPDAGADTAITLPANSILLKGSGSDPDGSIASYQWSQVSGPGQAIFSNPASASSGVSDLTEGTYTFRLTVTDNTAATGYDDVMVVVHPGTAENRAPEANAGADQDITLPGNSTVLNGSGTDSDGTIVAYNWRKISGPEQGAINTPDAAATTVSNLAEGTYTFRLTVTDDSGAIANDDVIVTVKTALNQAPNVNAGTDQSIILPESSVILSGTGTDSDGSIAAYAWTYVSGPAQGTITTADSASATVTGLEQGTYVFRLTVTDNSGAIASDDVAVVVYPAVSTTKYMKVNLYGGTNPYNNAEWNNWNVSASLNSGVLKYPNATVSTVSAAITRNTIADNGSTYGGTMAPAEVLRYTSYSGAARTLTFSGLSTSKSYDLELYASRNKIGNSTVFTIGTTSITIHTDKNKTNKATFTGLMATSTGQLVVSIKSGSTYNYLNGFILTEITSATTTITQVKAAEVKEPDVQQFQVQAFPNPSQHYFTLRIQSASAKVVQLRIVDAVGREVEVRQGLAPNTTTTVGHHYRPGTYFTEVLQEGKRASLKLVKQAP